VHQRPIEFPFPVPPKAGEAIEIAPGLFWLRLPLPFRLNHVNIYLIEDDGGFALIDTGLDSAEIRAVWTALFQGFLRAKRLTRIIATHSHPDHIGLAGWLAEQREAPLIASAIEYEETIVALRDPHALNREPHLRFYNSHGLDDRATRHVAGKGLVYSRIVGAPPPIFEAIAAGDRLRIGGRDFEALTGGGHSPDQIMLICEAERLFLAADQVLAKISPNISVEASTPDGDPLGVYLGSLEAIADAAPDDALVLPGHNLPFTGLKRRIGELVSHHKARCAMIAGACREAPRSVADLVPILFGRAVEDPLELSFAFGEALAHANYLVRRNALRQVGAAGGVRLEAVAAG
jgi:glyoxylase-like metal-dependent hydrolase (beta-lactamase superfamily II)